MKNAYLYLLIGTILMFFSLGIIGLDLIIHISGYALMIYAMSLLNEKYDCFTLTLASQFTVGLLLVEILQIGIARLLSSSTLFSILFITLILIVQLLIFYLIIKSEGDATESLVVQTYQQIDFFISIGLLVLYFCSYFSTFAYSLFAILDLCFFFFLLYIFYKLYQLHHRS